MKSKKSDTPIVDLNKCLHDGIWVVLKEIAEGIETELTRTQQLVSELQIKNLRYYKQNKKFHDELNEARECLKEAIAFVSVGNATLVSLERWRVAAGMESDK